MRNPSELNAFVLADELVLDIYRVTASFPSDERFGLTNQLRRSAVSVASNLVEGCSRESQADFARFVEIALGSAMEARYQLSLGRRLWIERPEKMEALIEVERKANEVVRMLINLGKTLRA